MPLPTTSPLPSHRTPVPDVRRRPDRDVGPAARLVALPQLEDGLPPTLADVDDHLARIERARRAQFDALPQSPDNVVAAAHRRIVARYVEQVREARSRVRAGTYGACARCASPLPPKALEREPWQTVCTACDPGLR
ncbi:hypothetical protein Q9S36_50635 [Microbacterium sp. ARD31]|uniref:hypothetical protein n=1 Tax=Microbacterium sp. ARD31 TaxID=2962576 RepID=UPI00288165A8|nr:hypothetical protein [Microbacterium sp. ARD31]MDT0188475.1 hypothetical protein [Microbacterium sp. ARD31]